MKQGNKLLEVWLSADHLLGGCSYCRSATSWRRYY